MEHSNKLKGYLKKVQAEYGLLEFDESIATCLDAVKQMGGEVENLVKSIAFYKKELVIIAIVRKEDKIDKAKLSRTLGLTGIKLCSPEETLEKTGYPPGGVPPLNVKAQFLMDKKVSEKSEVIAGGGDKHTLIKIKTQELLRLNRAMISDLGKES